MTGLTQLTVACEDIIYSSEMLGVTELWVKILDIFSYIVHYIIYTR